MKKWLAGQPPAATLTELQAQLDAFTAYYNHQRPHRALPRRWAPKRSDADITGKTGTVTLRHAGRLYHFGAGRTGQLIAMHYFDPLPDLEGYD